MARGGLWTPDVLTVFRLPGTELRLTAYCSDHQRSDRLREN
jgi:hypothetical protein